MKIILIIIGLVALVFAIKLGRKWHILKAYKILTGKSEQEELMAIRARETQTSTTTNLTSSPKSKSTTSNITAITLNEKTSSLEDTDETIMEDVFEEARRKHYEQTPDVPFDMLDNDISNRDPEKHGSATTILVEDTGELDQNSYPQDDFVPYQPTDILEEEEEPQPQPQDDFVPYQPTDILEEEEEPQPQDVKPELKPSTTSDYGDYEQGNGATSMLIDESSSGVLNSPILETKQIDPDEDTLLHDKGSEISTQEIKITSRLGAIHELKDIL